MNEEPSTSQEKIAAAKAEQEARYQADAWDDLIAGWITHEMRTVPGDGFSYDPPRKESVPRPVPLTNVSVGEILSQAIGLEPGRWTRADQMRVSAYLKRKGWQRSREEGARGEQREWRYKRGII